jgi:hypothetical protein
MEVLQSSIARHAKDPFVKSSICLRFRYARVEEKADCSDLFVVLSIDWPLSVERVPPAGGIFFTKLCGAIFAQVLLYSGRQQCAVELDRALSLRLGLQAKARAH